MCVYVNVCILFCVLVSLRISAGGGFGPGHSGILQVLEQHSIKLTLPQLSNDEVQKVSIIMELYFAGI